MPRSGRVAHAADRFDLVAFASFLDDTAAVNGGPAETCHHQWSLVGSPQGSSRDHISAPLAGSVFSF
jgi:hypothetical protein